MVSAASRGAGSNVKRRGQHFNKGTCFSAIIFLSGNICQLKLYCRDTQLLVAIMGRQTLTLILNNFIRCTALMVQNKISKRTYIA
jgi:hypothetical protein